MVSIAYGRTAERCEVPFAACVDKDVAGDLPRTTIVLNRDGSNPVRISLGTDQHRMHANVYFRRNHDAIKRQFHRFRIEYGDDMIAGSRETQRTLYPAQLAQVLQDLFTNTPHSLLGWVGLGKQATIGKNVLLRGRTAQAGSTLQQECLGARLRGTHSSTNTSRAAACYNHVVNVWHLLFS